MDIGILVLSRSRPLLYLSITLLPSLSFPSLPSPLNLARRFGRALWGPGWSPGCKRNFMDCRSKMRLQTLWQVSHCMVYA